MKIKLAVIFILLLNIYLTPQSISITGNVKDLENNSPLENAKVQIKNLDNGIIDSVFSDAIGNWQYDIATSVEDGI